jgi:hypothetical protein
VLHTILTIITICGVICSLTAAYLLAEKKNPIGWVLFLLSDALLGGPMFTTMMHWTPSSLLPTWVYVVQSMAYMVLNVRGILHWRTDKTVMLSEVE